MQHKRYCFTFILALIVSTFVAQAQYFQGFSVQGYRISSALPTSFRSVKGSVTANIGNTADTRTMSGITATVYRQGRRFAHGVCDDVTFFRGTREYVLNGQVSLADGVSAWDAIRAAFSFDASEYTIDFTVDITHPDGKVDHVLRSGIPLSHYLRR